MQPEGAPYKERKNTNNAAASTNRGRRRDSSASRRGYCAQAPLMQFGAPLWQPEASTHAGATSREVRQ